MRRRRIGNPFPSAIVACLQAGRAPTNEELRLVATRIEDEAELRARFASEPDRRLRFVLRAAFQATGMIELSLKERNRP